MTTPKVYLHKNPALRPTESAPLGLCEGYEEDPCGRRAVCQLTSEGRRGKRTLEYQFCEVCEEQWMVATAAQRKRLGLEDT